MIWRPSLVSLDFDYHYRYDYQFNPQGIIIEGSIFSLKSSLVESC